LTGIEATSRGAYGLRLEGAEEAADLLVEAAPDWPAVALAWRLGDGALEQPLVTPVNARLRLQTGGRIEIDREEGRAEFVVSRPLSAQELVHPYLVPVAAVMAHWYGRESVHAGAFVGGDGVWGVVGDRESGKSSTLARLALDGVGVVSDDLLVLEGLSALAGPRSIDLREGPAARLGVGASIGVAGARERWRLPIGPLDGALQLRGWIHLAWGPRVEAVPLRGGDRVARLFSQRPGGLPSLAPEVLLELAALPSFELRRPRVWESLGEAADCLRELTGD
jgi:hypothetical protein